MQEIGTAMHCMPLCLTECQQLVLLVWAASGAFEACRGVTYWDQPLMLYLLPFLMVEAAGQGGDGLQLVAQEIHAVMQVCQQRACMDVRHGREACMQS